MMTDFEMTKLCAEAMDILNEYPWDPLHDDAQNSILDRYLLSRGIIRMTGSVFEFYELNEKPVKKFQFVGNMSNPDDYRRSRVECVAKMQAQRTSGWKIVNEADGSFTATKPIVTKNK